MPYRNLRHKDKAWETTTYFISFSYFHDGKQMIGGSSDNSARRWDLQTGREIVGARIVWEQYVYAMAVSRDSRWVVTGGQSNGSEFGDLTAYEVDTRKMKIFRGHSDSIHCVDISVDNKLLASGSKDSTARIWDFVEFPQSQARASEVIPTQVLQGTR